MPMRVHQSDVNTNLSADPADCSAVFGQILGNLGLNMTNRAETLGHVTLLPAAGKGQLSIPPPAGHLDYEATVSLLSESGAVVGRFVPYDVRFPCDDVLNPADDLEQSGVLVCSSPAGGAPFEREGYGA